jgi:hypothetical protein
MLVPDNRVRWELGEIMYLDWHDIHEDVTSRKGKVLSNEVNYSIVCVFGARDVDMADPEKFTAWATIIKRTTRQKNCVHYQQALI